MRTMLPATTSRTITFLYCALSALGLTLTLSWVVPILQKLTLLPRLLCQSFLFFGCLSIFLIRYAMVAFIWLQTLRVSNSRFSALFLGAIGFSLFDLCLTYYFPSAEVVTIYFYVVDSFIGKSLLGIAGPMLFDIFWFILAGAIWNRSAKLLMFVMVIIPILIVFNRYQLAERKIAGRLDIVGLQYSPTPIGQHWQEDIIDHFRKHERLSKGFLESNTVFVWPEGAYPYVERLSDDAPSLRHLPAPENGFRLVGLLAARNFLQRLNAVMLQSSNRQQYRTKQIVVPLYETNAQVYPLRTRDILLINDIDTIVPICYEILDRKYYSTPTQLGISISSDLADPSGAMSLLLSRATWLRALEFQIPFIRVSNKSASLAVDANGNIAAYMPAIQGQFEVEVDIYHHNWRFPYSVKFLIIILILYILASFLDSPKRLW